MYERVLSYVDVEAAAGMSSIAAEDYDAFLSIWETLFWAANRTWLRHEVRELEAEVKKADDEQR